MGLGGFPGVAGMGSSPGRCPVAFVGECDDVGLLQCSGDSPDPLDPLVLHRPGQGARVPRQAAAWACDDLQAHVVLVLAGVEGSVGRGPADRDRMNRRKIPGPPNSSSHTKHSIPTPDSEALRRRVPTSATYTCRLISTHGAPQARPTPDNILARLARVLAGSPSAGLAKLEEANHQNVIRRGEAERQQSAYRSESERREALVDAATQGFSRIADALKEAITQAAPSANDL
jgi:hypothetical protein